MGIAAPAKRTEGQKLRRIIEKLDPSRPVLIAGPTASGKSALALAIAETQGGVIVNADASQVYACWRVLTARPPAEEEARAPHALFGHLPYDALYSAGAWLREAVPFLRGGPRPIFVGGTGLYFTALTEGLSNIPATPPELRTRADTLSLEALRADLDPDTTAKIDLANRARVQRAWEVQTATGVGLAAWQADTPPPALPLSRAHAFVMDAPKEWLTPRIERRFDMMLEGGALAEAEAMLARYDPALASCRAIGAPELIDYLRGDISLKTARERATVATRQYAKRQRTWFRKRCKDWETVDSSAL